MTSGEDQGRSTEDLFEDLDKFFEPVDEDDWAQMPDEPAPPPGEPAARGDEPAPGDDAPPPATPRPPIDQWSDLRQALGDDEDEVAPPAGLLGLEDHGPQAGPAEAPEPEVEPQTEAPEPEVEPQTEAPEPEVEPQTEAPEPEVAATGWLDGAEDESELAGVYPAGSISEAEGSGHEEAASGETVTAGGEALVTTRPAVASDEPAPEPVEESYVGVGEFLTEADPDSTPAEAPATGQEPVWEEPRRTRFADAGESARQRLAGLGASFGGATAGRDLPAAVITAAVLIAAALITIAIDKAAFVVVGGIVTLIAQAELYATMRRRGYQPATALGLILGAMLIAGAYLKGETALVLFVALGLALSFLWYMVAPPKARAGVVRNVGATMLGLIYVAFLAGYMFVLLAGPDGRAIVLSVLGLTFLYDVAAYGVGSVWGRHPMAPTISPRKSWEGLIGATIVTLIVAIVIMQHVQPFGPSLARSVGLGIIVVVLAPMGDLVESVLKRDLGVKDMGSILPGHGGMLDRIDSVLFVAPAVVYFLHAVL